jgi:hypothetical protein
MSAAYEMAAENAVNAENAQPREMTAPCILF